MLGAYAGPPSPPFLPLVYGNQSWAIGTDSAGPEDLSTHRWKAFVSSPIGPDYDLSKIIRRVQFELHETFKDHKRVVDRFPFDVEESGWGEFEIRLKISFVDPFNKPVELLHPLKLYGNVETHLTSRQKPLVFEFYDEILFPGLLEISPTETTATAAFRAAVLDHQKGVAKCDAWKEWKAREEMDLRYIAATRKQVQQELRIVAREVEKLDQDKADKGGRTI